MRRAPAVLLTALALAGCGGDGDDSGPDATAATRIALYYLDGEHLAGRAALLPGATPSPLDAVEALLANDAGHASEIPAGTRVRDVAVTDGTAAVDLSAAFGSGGGSLSMQARVAQVVYTLTQFPAIERVTFELDGRSVEAIGGEGVPAREVTRADVANVLPPIFVDPPPGPTASPLVVRGSASVYEGTVSLRLESGGEVLAAGFATAAEGGPARGDFAAELEFELDEPADAVLVAFEHSADDGSESKVVRIPVRLCPSEALLDC